MNESFRAQTWGYIRSDTSIGTQYDKALYKGYTDATFEKRSEHPDWAGFQGPILRAEVGDLIEVCIHRSANCCGHVPFSSMLTSQ
jgi:hypothetical protein